jgi:hypothetical protein
MYEYMAAYSGVYMLIKKIYRQPEEGNIPLSMEERYSIHIAALRSKLVPEL